MEEHTEWLLRYPDEVLFKAGGCHVFALLLHKLTGHPLLRIHGGSHDHIACQPADEFVLDYFGWHSYPGYIVAEMIEPGSVRFERITEEELRLLSTEVEGGGYYVHPDFLPRAETRSRAWLARHHDVFDGTRKIAIPGGSRVQKFSQAELGGIFGGPSPE
jgi:hypothetical protein